MSVLIKYVLVRGRVRQRNRLVSTMGYYMLYVRDRIIQSIITTSC